MPFPAESGRPTRRVLGRGPGAPDPARRPEAYDAGADREGPGAPDGPQAPEVPETAEVHDVPETSGAPEAPAESPAPAAGGTEPERSPRPADGPQEPPGPDPSPAAGTTASPDRASPAGGDGRFTLRLANFEGPFDLLLQLISRHKLDVTEVALSQVTDEFMAYIRAMGPDWDLDQTTEFLVVAATLLDLKAARLLPVAEVEDEADLALLEARDLLFARLLQYRAYKQIAEIFERRAEAEGRRYPRTVGLEPHHADLLPEVVISLGPEGFARLAVKAMQPRAEPQVYVDHIHAPLVSVREQAGLVVRMLKARGEATFQELTEDAEDTLTVVARFLALLELYREKAVVLDQEEALRTLTVRWSGGDGDGMPTVTDEFDRIVEAKD
ncbi:segregation/condensation protein A [Streptomyces virginiae]|uniref:segregation and condensation protein A n=1 Tax=Streptomyces virginiae TaxID=1961 RepID=UPI002DD80FC6|nr:segregation/condensation protein A [Streptomyces virginiae]WSC76894.1 segregation/condensation protein A [Streptomyces virginiae]